MKHKLAIVGFGGMAGWHFDLINELENLEVVGVWDIDEQRRELAVAKGVMAYERLEALLDDVRIQIVLIATPNDAHKDIAIAAMKAGKNVVVEKPVTLNSIALQEMITISEETGMLLTVHQNRRWDEDFLMVCEILKENYLGEVFGIESRVHGSRGIPGDWRQLKEQGGGMVLDWGVHLFDQILLMFPGVKLKTVHAMTTHVTNQLVDDGFRTELLFENGVRVLVEVGTSNFVSLPRWYVQGVNGTAVIEDFNKKGKMVIAVGENEKDIVPVITAAGLTKTMAPRREDRIKQIPLPEVTSDIREFYQNVMAVIEKGEASLIKLSEIARVMRLMEAVFESAEKNEVITFER
jgi:predicted dehydrogenase